MALFSPWFLEGSKTPSFFFSILEGKKKINKKTLSLVRVLRAAKTTILSLFAIFAKSK